MTTLIVSDFISDADTLEQPPSLQDGPLKDDDVWTIVWSSGTTGNPKGIQYAMGFMRTLVRGYHIRKDVTPPGAVFLITTCFFHAGGFTTPLNCMTNQNTFVFNHGPDLDKTDPTEMLYREVDQFKPFLMICGSHHLVLLGQTPPKDKDLALDSVVTVMPMGSSVPPTLYEDLKANFPSLMAVYSFYGMSEIGAIVTQSFNVRQLGIVGPDVIVKIVNPETGKICGPEEVHKN